MKTLYYIVLYYIASDFCFRRKNRANLSGHNNEISIINHGEEDRKLEIKNYYINNDYIRVFELENIILYEIEKNLQSFIVSLKTIKDPSTLLIQAKESILVFKKIITSKEDIVGNIYIQSMFNGLYLYCNKIAKLVGVGIFGPKIVKDEQELLDMLKNLLDINGEMLQEYITHNRGLGPNTQILFK